MASNKECLVIIIDVRESHDNGKSKEKAIRCVSDILKDKICAARKDLVTFLLMGTKNSKNQLNTKTLDYKNIVEYPQPEMPSWQLLCNFLKFVNEEEPGSESEADWLDALIVALQVHYENESEFKCPHRRILLIHDFDDSTKNFDEFDIITKNLIDKDIGLIVVSDSIRYITNPDTYDPETVFQKFQPRTKPVSKSESFALRLKSDCNAKLCNFEEAVLTTFKLSNSRPWTWSGNLIIGSQISIAISGIIAIKDENNIKLKKCWGEVEELPSREKRSYVKGVEMEPDADEVITGYMLGATPIPFDEPIEDMEEIERYQTGLKFLGFPKIDSIPEEYYTGDSLYWITHQKGMSESAKKLDALVKGLLTTQRGILCWKIFSPKYNTPKLVVLVPNQLSPFCPSSLSMIELTYHAQHHYWDFPSLRTDKTKCSEAQLDAVDNLIDSMNLMIGIEHEPRQTIETELLSTNVLPHIFENNMMDVLERKVLGQASEDDEQFQKMLSEKNFVEAFWAVPEVNEVASKRAAKKVRELFPLEKNGQALKSETNTNGKKTDVDGNCKAEDALKPLSIDCIGIMTPDEDFEKLIKHHVLPLKDKTNRDQQFNFYAEQMRNVIWELIFDMQFLHAKKIENALFAYREFCYDFNAFTDYNEWMSKVKVAVQERKDLHEFWVAVVKGRNLGLCFIGQPTVEELLKIDEFFKLSPFLGSFDCYDIN